MVDCLCVVCLWFCGRIIPAPGEKKLPLFCFLENYHKFPPEKIGSACYVFSSFAVKDENLYGIDEDSLPNLHE
jgi:hypothetical protein